MNNAHNIAHYVLHLFQASGESITNLKLQKLLYYIQGWNLGLHHKSIFKEDFEAWIHGPVIHQYFMSLNITNGTQLEMKQISKQLSVKLQNILMKF